MGTRLANGKKQTSQAGRPTRGKPNYPVKSIRDLEPAIYMKFKHWAEEQKQTVGEALTKLMQTKLYEIEQEYLEQRAENIRGR